MKTLNTKSAEPRKSVVRVDDNSRAECDKSKVNGDEVDDIEIDGSEVGDDEVEKKVQKTSKAKNLSKSKKTVGSDFLTPGARLTFTKLRQAFVEALILHHFDPERHIWVEIYILDYAISKVFSQLTSEGLWHTVTFFSHMIIPAEIKYKMHNGELLAILKVFKTWKHYLEGSQHKVLMLTNHNNLR